MADGLEGLFSDFPAPTSFDPSASYSFSNTPSLNLLQDLPAPQTTPPAAMGTSLTGGPTLSPDPSVPGGGWAGPGWGSVIGAAIPAATGLIGLFRGQGGAGDKALKQQYQATQPLQNASNAALNAYSTGTLRPPDQAAIDQYKKQRMAQYQQQLAAMGIPIGSAQADIQGMVDRDALVLQQQILNNYMTQGTQATGISASNLTNYAREQMVADQQQRQQWAQLMAELGKLGTQVDWGSLFS